MKNVLMKKVAALSMVAMVAAAPAVCLATNLNGKVDGVEVDSGISALNAPLKKLGGAMTGAVPKIGVTVAAAGGALSWAMGTEQQIVKYATRAAMGGGIAMAAPSVVNELTEGTQTEGASGCEF